MTPAGTAVTLRGVTKSFPVAGGRALQVLDVERLELPGAGCTVIKGRSGSGKTTLLNLIAGVSAPTAGTIVVQDTEITALPEARRDRFRAAQIGYVFQTFNLLAALQRARERHARDDVRGARSRGDSTARRAARDPRPARPGRAPRPHAGAALPRGAAAGRDRPGAGERSPADPGRRALRQPGCGHRARGARGAPRASAGRTARPCSSSRTTRRSSARATGSSTWRELNARSCGDRVTPVTVVWRYLQGRFRHQRPDRRRRSGSG